MLLLAASLMAPSVEGLDKRNHDMTKHLFISGKGAERDNLREHFFAWLESGRDRGTSGPPLPMWNQVKGGWRFTSSESGALPGFAKYLRGQGLTVEERN
jgi:hypothetical protein